MKRFFLVLVVMCLVASLFATSGAEINVSEPDTLNERFAYSYGYLLSASLANSFPDINADYLAKGAYDFFNNQALYSQSEMNAILSEYSNYLMEKSMAEQEALAKKNLEEAEAFLKVNAANKNVQTTASGLQYQVITKGTGAIPTMENSVEVDYQTILMDGKVVDSSYQRGKSSTFSLANAISGFAEGICLMPVGSKYRFWIHPDLGYGSQGNTSFPPNSLLIFEVELIAIN